MAKAHLTTKNGTTVVIEGTAPEVAELMKQFEVQPTPSRNAGAGRRKTTQQSSKATPVNLVSTLIDSGFFRKPQELGAVKAALEEMGHHYPVTSLSPLMLRLVRKRQIRRLRKDKRWVYTGG